MRTTAATSSRLWFDVRAAGPPHGRRRPDAPAPAVARDARRPARRRRPPVLERGHRGGARAEHAALDRHGQPRSRAGGPRCRPPPPPARPGCCTATRPGPRVPLVGPRPRPPGGDQPPGDAALVEAAAHHGQGLLAGGGVGGHDHVLRRRRDQPARDEPVAHQGPGRWPRPGASTSASSPARSASPARCLTVGEMVKELYQARRQRVATCSRASRGRLVRRCCAASATCCCGDLNVVAGRRAHAARGAAISWTSSTTTRSPTTPGRPAGVAAVARRPRRRARHAEQSIAVAPRDYEIVVCPTTGRRSARPTNSWRQTLLDRVRALMADRRRRRGEQHGEDWGPLERAGEQRAEPPPRVGGARPRPGTAEQPDAADLPDVVTVGSGNLGLVWFPRVAAPADARGLPGALARARRPAWRNARRRGRRGRHRRPRLVAIGPGARPAGAGRRGARGRGPALPYGPRGRPDLLRAARLPHTGDLLLILTVSRPRARARVRGPGRLARRHRRAQNHAFLLHPRAWPIATSCARRSDDDAILVGAEPVHAQLVRWADGSGLDPDVGALARARHPCSTSTASGY